VEVGVARIDRPHAVLEHQGRGVGVVDQVPRELRNILDQVGQH